MSQSPNPDDFREIKVDCINKISVLESKFSTASDTPKNIDRLLSSVIDNLGRLDILYENATVNPKRQIIGSIYPEKLIFDGLLCRTPRINEAVRIIYSLGERFYAIKNRKAINYAFPVCSPYENRTRDSSVKGMRLNPLTNGPFCFWECKDIVVSISFQNFF